MRDDHHPPAPLDDDLRTRLQEIAETAPELSADLHRALVDPGPTESEPHIEVIPARAGPVSLKVHGKWVHSSFDPQREATRRVQALTFPEEPRDGTILIGLGMGYLLEELEHHDRARAMRGTTIGVVFHPRLLEQALRHRSPEWWLRYGPDRIVPAWLPGLLVPVLQHHEIRSFMAIPLGALGEIFPDMMATITTALDHYRERTEVNRNTLRRFGHLWVRNTLRSIRQFGIFPGVDGLVHRAPGAPVVVCGAGPTLDDLLPDLREYWHETLVIAVDTAVIALQEQGIEPDLAVISDPQYWNTRHLDRIGATTAVLVAEPATHPRTLRLWPGPAVMSASLFPLGSYIDSRTNRRLKLGSGGSVATSAWDLARVIGAKSIAMAGTDLGFPRYRTHCAGSFFETRLAAVASRLEPAEHGLWRYLHGARAIMTPAAGGGSIPSDARMKVYRSWFSERPAQYPEISTVLLSPESSAIAGIPYAPIKTWIADHGNRSRVAAARRYLRSTTTRDTGDAASVLQELLMSLQEMERITSSGLEICTAIRRDQDTLDESHLLRRMASLDQVDRRLGALDDREIVGFISGTALEEIATGNAGNAVELLNQAELLYRSLHDAAVYHIDLLKRYDFS
ncbi:MAG: 6-hydroxymethylpterin diphosphokinase MptE-like protein [Alkalispirochaeta sp.]